MQLKDKVAVIYGGGGTIGGASARAFAREGARVFLAGRTRAKMEKVANDIVGAGGSAEIAELDALDPAAVAGHADAVATSAGGIDIAMNALGFWHVQGKPFTDLSLDEFMSPIDNFVRSQFTVARAVAGHMAKRGSGVIINLSTPGSFMVGTGYLGYGVTCAAKEAFSRLLAAELGATGIRTVCIRPHAIPEASSAGSYARDVFGPIATASGMSIEEMMAGAAQGTTLKRLPTLREVADTAVFVASDGAASMTGAIVNLSSGLLVD